MKNLRIVFMGTPEFAVPSLELLVKEGWNVVGVITAPDKPKGRGRKLQTPPVSQKAHELGLNVLQPTNLKSPEFIQELRDLQPDLQVVVAFRMLPEVVWKMPKYGTFNLHGSLLPRYRGAAPIHWAIIRGENKTGLTTFFLKHDIDTGSIIFQEEETIKEEDTVGSLYERLMHKGAKLVERTVSAIASDQVKTQEQTGKITQAPKIHKPDCQIDWNKPTNEVYNFIRGLSPFPTAWTVLDGKICKIFQATKSDKHIPAGKWQTESKQSLLVGTSDGAIEVKELMLEGKKRMSAEDFLRGYTISESK